MPIHEYSNSFQQGCSVTGGFVYRGKKIPALVGKYVYADYVTGKVWALDYDHKNGKVVGNFAIKGQKMPVISFGEDEHGELYFMIVSATGRGIYRLTAK